MPKPLFSKLVAQAAIGLFCIVFGSVFAFHANDLLFFIMSLAIGICCIVRFILLHRTICQKRYQTISGTCVSREPSFIRKTQQIRLLDFEGSEHVFTVDKNVKLLQGHTYQIYFRPSPSDDASISNGFLGFEEIIKPEKAYTI
ncbi:hypothetical protein BRYFOR_08970 [Marvinbryantia formatexigens DSM 14469]|uniref:Uncharacterized protein n=1 Tax=Marvinbryantia formatexigens DSM 14469 TaxID=478749 RepID=C6LJY3_9FIRM|nr:hypothetical protein [Marvinbryantia formatexigens]EET59061.1 hypothetical protein BRYFOR_08970 [Marvinbryantia formatexigens DSM 14469]UWO23602.1 hypothetical protein NQ534_14230 [Marvinbryantia formatexigens DSM 14469]SDG83356.1 hypothetical protein SAMN05660368_03363 [Marvinbryantia formatexigens]